MKGYFMTKNSFVVEITFKNTAHMVSNCLIVNNTILTYLS